jgi:type III restriction enzyme
MSTFAPKTYQQQVLDSVEAYFKACHELPSPSIAFTATTERLWGRGNPYNPLSGFPPTCRTFCLRVPTGGGKTWLAAKSVALVNTHLLRCEHSVILWLVPSKPIREQTLARPARPPCIPTTRRCAKPGRSRCWIWTKPRA